MPLPCRCRCCTTIHPGHLHPGPCCCVLQEGWMHTGDLATLDGEGYCRVVGRLKDVIIRGGENVYPR
jgi:acyl-CoA synthetase (AMP-forming)/AMP-acid ligase II